MRKRVARKYMPILKEVRLKNYEDLMGDALQLATKAYQMDEVPVGALIIDHQNIIIAEDFNKKEQSFNPVAHAEVLAVQKASSHLKNWRLLNATLIVTLEPCVMCLSAALQARIKRIVFGSYDFKYGALSLGHRFHQDGSHNHKIEIIGGVRHQECSQLMKDFFARLRKN